MGTDIHWFVEVKTDAGWVCAWNPSEPYYMLDVSETVNLVDAYTPKFVYQGRDSLFFELIGKANPIYNGLPLKGLPDDVSSTTLEASVQEDMYDQTWLTINELYLICKLHERYEVCDPPWGVYEALKGLELALDQEVRIVIWFDS